MYYLLYMETKLINIDKIMNAKPIDEPWQHFIVDDVINLDFTEINSFIKDDNLYYRLQDEFQTYLPSILDKFKPVRLDKDDEIFVDIRFISTPPDSYGGVHGDNLQKVWTIIIYAWPEKSSGTVLWTNVSLDESPHCYDEDNDGLEIHNGDIIESVMHSEVDWKVNRAIFFSTGEKKDGWTETPHQIINASKDTGRLILMFNVFKSKLGGVHSKEECKPFSKQNFDDYCG